MDRDLTRSVTREIDAPPQRVWDLVTDVTQMGRWSPETTACEWLDGADRAVPGARFRGSNHRGWSSWKTTCTVVEASPARAFAFEVGSGPDSRWRYDLEPTERGTRVTESVELLRFGTGGRIATWLTTGVRHREDDLARGMETTLARLAEAATTEVRS